MDSVDPRVGQIVALLEEVRREAYQQGWRDAVNQITQAVAVPPPHGVAPVKVVAVAKEKPAPAKPVDKPKAKRGPGAPNGKRLPRGAAEEVVLLVMSERPEGMRIPEIAAASESLGTPLQQQSIRLVLLRLEEAGRVIRDGRSWQLVAEPAQEPPPSPPVILVPPLPDDQAEASGEPAP